MPLAPLTLPHPPRPPLALPSYDGEFVNGQIEGHGEQIFKGGKYEGEWKSGKREGEGILRLDNGMTYRGSFKAHVFDGFGEQKLLDGEVYKGEWVNGMREGTGMLLVPNLDAYYGKFSKGMCGGWGRWRSKDGWEIEGEFRLDGPVKATMIVYDSGTVFNVVYDGRCTVRDKDKAEEAAVSKELVGAYIEGWEGSRDVEGPNIRWVCFALRRCFASAGALRVWVLKWRRFLKDQGPTLCAYLYIYVYTIAHVSG